MEIDHPDNLWPEFTPHEWYIAKYLHTNWVEYDDLDRVIREGIEHLKEKNSRIEEENKKKEIEEKEKKEREEEKEKEEKEETI